LLLEEGAIAGPARPGLGRVEQAAPFVRPRTRAGEELIDPSFPCLLCHGCSPGAEPRGCGSVGSGTVASLDLNQAVESDGRCSSQHSGHDLGAGRMLRVLYIALAWFAAIALPVACRAAENRTLRQIQEEIWALPLTLPTVAYVVRPVGNGPFPLAV